MRITVVHSHPRADSFSKSLLDATCGALSTHHLDVCNLYEDGFRPALSDREHRDYLGDQPISDPLVEQYADYVRAADAMIFVYPTWWSGMPAMMKGFLDRVMVRGVAFDFDKAGRIEPALPHVKRLAGVTTYGSSRLVVALGADGGRRTVNRTIRAATGIRTRTTWLGLYSMDTAGTAEREAFIHRVHREFSQW